MMLYKLLSGIDRHRYSPAVISLLDRGTIGPLLEQLDIPVYPMNMRGGVPSPRVLGRLAAAMGALRPHVIQGWMYHGNLAATYCSLFCRRTPVCWNVRQSLYSFAYEKRGTVLVIKAGAMLSRHPSRIIYNAHESALHHERVGYHSARSVVIPNGFDVDRFVPDTNASERVRAELGIPGTSPLIGLIARYHPMKDHDNFLQSASLLREHCPESHFLLVGRDVDSHNAELREKVESLGLSGCVHLLGERADIPRITAALDVAALSSFAEAFPNIVGEAMACAVPCAVTDVGDAARIVGDTGRVVPPRNPQALAAAWLELLAMAPDERRSLGQKARRRICQNFSLGAVVHQYESLYDQLVTKEG